MPRTGAGASLPKPRAQNLTGLLKRWSGGDPRALERLIPLVDAELRRMARRYLRNEPLHPALDRTTALVNETYERLLRQGRVRWESRLHFFGIAARVMRQILVDHARRERARKRGGGAKEVTLTTAVGAAVRARGLDVVEVIAVHEALDRLALLDSRQAQVVELRFFGGLTIEETAELLDVSLDTVKRDWRNARLWLKRELRGAAS
jgi:RNA polymerase sigma factor (TIGR02999 family)